MTCNWPKLKSFVLVKTLSTVKTTFFNYVIAITEEERGWSTNMVSPLTTTSKCQTTIKPAAVEFNAQQFQVTHFRI